jgi:hypothetical protein
MPPQTAIIFWILIIFALIVPALAGVGFCRRRGSTMRDPHHIGGPKRRRRARGA